MSGNILRFTFYLVCMLSLASCGGGGGGGGGSKPPKSSAAPLDSDGDGRPDVQDVFPTDPKEWIDTDKDGVGDNGDAFPNDASETRDTDKDGVGDNKDRFPNDATEWMDADSDGTGDNADTTPMGQAIPAWPTYQGDAKHTGWVDITLAPINFKQRWSIAVDLPSSQQGVAADGYIFFNRGDAVVALDARDGSTLWTRFIATANDFSYNQPAYADGIVYIQTGNYQNAYLWAFNAVDGALVFQTAIYQQGSNARAPIIVDGTVYVSGGNYDGVYAIDARTGKEKWWQTFNQYYQFGLAISGNHAITYTGSYPSKLAVIDRVTGNLSFEIMDQVDEWSGTFAMTTPVIAGDYVLVTQYGRLVAFNLATRQRVWEVKSDFQGQAVIKGDRLYILHSGAIQIRSLSDGALLGTITGNQQFYGDLLVTNNLLFVQDGQNTHAYQLDTGELAWSLSDKPGGFLMAEGALVVFTASGVVALDLEGDIDTDGLPDWWEKRYKKNIDPASDTDGDGLTALQEFNLLINPLLVDTDGDGLSDGEEVAGGKSSPVKADTDGDGLNDYAEIKTHLTDPAKADSDGDSLSDTEEITAGLNPLDSDDALADNDGDGFSNLHEWRAHTGINEANSRPHMDEWSMQSGNVRRNNYTPLLLDDSRFSERWTTTSYLGFNSPLTVTGGLILQFSAGQFSSWDSGTGIENWRLPLVTGLRGTATTPGKLVYFSDTGNNNYGFQVIDAVTGTHLLSKTVGSYGSYISPLLSDDKVYFADNNRTFKAYSLSTGNLLWTTPSGNEYYDVSYQHLVGNGQLIAMSSSKFSIFSTANGSLVKTISLPNTSIGITMLGSKDNLIVQTSGDKIESISIADGTRAWISQECSGNKMAVGNGHIYIMDNYKLCVLDEQTGALRWTLSLPNYGSAANMVVTASHLFYSDYNATYGVNLALKSVTWSIAKSASALALGADGTLYLQSNSSVTAIDTEGDTDGDGLLQWWERRYGGDLVATADDDADGLTNLQEFANKTNPLAADTDADGLGDSQEINTTRTNPLVADSDKDGLIDGVEVNTHETDPLMADSDEDGIDDGRELALGLDPLDEDDASDDNDSDGFSNRDEVYSGSDFTSATSKPTASDWAMKQANAAHNGFQPYRLDEGNFSLRWSKTFSTAIQPIATGDNHVFVLHGSNYNSNALFSLNPVDGKQEWIQDLSTVNYMTSPSYDGAQVVLQSSSPDVLRRFNTDSGTAAASISYTGSISNDRRPPTLAGTTAYIASYNGIVATKLDTGVNLWSNPVQTSGADIALNSQYLFYSYLAQIHALDRTTGVHAFSLNTQSTSNSSLVLGTRNNILTYQNGLISFDITTRKMNWQLPSSSYYEGVLPAVANGQVYYLSDSFLTSVDEVDGRLRWSWRPDDQYLSSNIIATLGHIFVASSSKTYALSAATGEVLWTYDAGGSLALGADGALYIQSNQQLIAINLEGDSDKDGMPDWWERHYGFNVNDTSDAALDLDGDGLTNLEEFTHKTYADRIDSDGDSLNDEDEVNTHHTDPTSTDSDGDGMRDDWELDNSLDPLDAADRDTDSDGDSVPNYFEYLVGKDPNDATSLPGMFSAGVYSFEDSALPTGWILSSDTTDVSISLNNASHGTKALQMRSKADISFVGFFAASDLSLDVKAGCDYSNSVEIYVDDQLMSRTQATSQWAKIKTVIPLGMHTVSIRTNSYSCAIYLDNVVITAAKTNTQLGVQFVGLYDDQLQFVDATRKVVRSISAKSPNVNLGVLGMAAVDNDKIVLVFGGNETRLGVLDLATFNWRYFNGLDPISNYYYSGLNGVAARGNFAYVATRNTLTGAGSISRVNLTSGAISRFGSHIYTSLALDNAGSIYAYSDGVVYKYDATTHMLDSKMNTVNAQQILIDTDNRLIVAGYNEVVRYNAQRLIDLRLSLINSARSVAVNDRNELLVTTQNNQTLWYAADWQRSKTVAIPFVYLASFPQLDSDNDGMPDWWELANSLNIADVADATLDSDSDSLTNLEEFTADTNPAVDDTDGDLLSDGDEVKDFGTNPNKSDTDSDGLMDAEEVLDHHTNPLLADSDADTVSDFLELHHFLTDPNDAASKPATLVNFVESFENTLTGWIQPTQADAGWTVVTDSASSGSKSLRANAVGDNQSAQIEWHGIFNQSMLSFDVKVSGDSCCGQLWVYVDGVQWFYSSSTNQWQSQSLPMSAGFHTIRFVFQRYAGLPSNTNTAWIDNIRVD